MSWTYKLEGDPSQISQQNLNQPVDLRKPVSSTKTYKSNLVSQSKKETPMISKTRHDDGGSGNPRFHAKMRTTHRFVKIREYKKRHTNKNL